MPSCSYRLLVVAGALVCHIGAAAGAQATRPVRTPPPVVAPATPDAFAAAYVRAMRAGDSLGIQRLVHPAALACLTGGNAEFLAALVSKDLRRRDQVAADYDVTVATLEPSPWVSSDTLYRFAVEPERRVSIDFSDANGSGLTIVRELAPANDGWMMTVPCPTMAGLRVFRAQRAANAAEAARSRTLIGALPDSLRLALTQLLKQGKTTAAISRFRAATGQDSIAATRVVHALGGTLR